MEKKSSTFVHIRVDVESLERFDAFAAEIGCTRTSAMKMAMSMAYKQAKGDDLFKKSKPLRWAYGFGTGTSFGSEKTKEEAIRSALSDKSRIAIHGRPWVALFEKASASTWEMVSEKEEIATP